MSITHWPIEDRPREKLLQHGAKHLTDAELIAIFLQTGTRGKSALDLAKTLLTQQGGLTEVLLTTLPIFTQTPGLGRAKYAALMAARELGRRANQISLQPGMILNSSQLTIEFIAYRLQDHANEVFACLFLDTHFRMIHFEELFHGTVNEATIYPREIVRRGLKHNAAKIVLAHNHPSGNPKPSEADRYITQLIMRAVELVDIRVVDHIIIGRGRHFSFAEEGCLEKTAN